MVYCPNRSLEYWENMSLVLAEEPHNTVERRCAQDGSHLRTRLLPYALHLNVHHELRVDHWSQKFESIAMRSPCVQYFHFFLAGVELHTVLDTPLVDIRLALCKLVHDQCIGSISVEYFVATQVVRELCLTEAVFCRRNTDIRKMDVPQRGAQYSSLENLVRDHLLERLCALHQHDCAPWRQECAKESTQFIAKSSRSTLVEQNVRINTVESATDVTQKQPDSLSSTNVANPLCKLQRDQIPATVFGTECPLGFPEYVRLI